MNDSLAPPEPPKRLTEIAAILACSDEQFDRAFRLAQARKGGEPFSIFSRGESALKGRSLFEKGLKLAWLEGWLNPLLGQLVADGLDNGRLLSQRASPANSHLETSAVEQQRNVRGLGTYGEPVNLERGRVVARYCGQVLIDDGPAGSGFLIGPDLFLTAWHVVKDLIKPAAAANRQGGAWVTEPASRLKIAFNFIRRIGGGGQDLELARSEVRLVKVARQWLEWGAPAPKLDTEMPAADKFQDDWDYAVIRLAEPVGYEYTPARLESRPLPKKGQRVWIFQYPRGMPLKYDAHDFLGVYGKAQERFFYKVETDNGSSGGPCLDDEFRIVGIHLAAWIKNTPNIGGEKVNFGVPVEKLFAHAGKKPAALMPHPATAGLRRLRDNTHPVVGRWNFQLLVWNELLEGARRRIVIVPDDGSPGRGKSFLGHILRSMLPPPMHHVAVVSAEALAKAGLQDGYRLLLARLGAGEREVDGPQLAGAMPFLRTTPAARPRDSLVPDFIGRVGDVRGERTVWIIIDELDRHEIENLELREFLYLLYQQVLSVSWLRFMLIGFKGDMPALGQAQSYVLRYPESGALAPISPQDVNAHISALVGEYDAAWTDADIRTRADAIVAGAGDSFSAEYARTVATEVYAIENEILQSRGNGI